MSKMHMPISVVIPTCNRRSRLLFLLESLHHSTYPFLEVIIVDSGNDRLTPSDYERYKNLSIQYILSPASVCIQRNIGIKKARAPWIFLCDDDIEVPSDYIQRLTGHLQDHPETGAVSGLFLQLEGDRWTAQYPLHATFSLLLTFIFQWSVWGAIIPRRNNFLTRSIQKYYQRKGNHISKAGWPVLTDFGDSSHYFITPLYSLGACLVKRDWLLQSPYDEVLDRHGMGDNYGVALGFPGHRIDVLNQAFVYHHREAANRLQRPLQYFRRVLALDYFINQQRLPHTKRSWLLWSLTGKLLTFILTRDWRMIRPLWKAIRTIAIGRNPYILAARIGKKVTEPSYSEAADKTAKPWTGKDLPKRILAIRLQAMGDMAITLPYLQHLRSSLPASVRLDFLTRAETKDIPQQLQLFDKVIVLGGGRSFRKQLLYTFLLLPSLLLKRYDVIIDLQNNTISRIVRKSLMPVAWSAFDRFSPLPAGERTRQTIEAVGLGSNQMDTHLTIKDPSEGMALLWQKGWNGQDMLVILNPAGASVTRNWEIPNYIRFAQLWLQKFPDTRFLVLGTAFIRTKADWLKRELRSHLIDLVELTTPAEAFTIVQKASMVISEDSGLMHMAWVTGVPTLALFGSTRSDWARPLGPHTDFLDSSDLSCGNCMQVVCRFGDNRCLTRYTPEQIYWQAYSLFNRHRSYEKVG